MVKKGRYELFSYFREDCLIFYKSKNDNKEIVAFTIILIDSIPQIFSVITDFLGSRLIDSFSIQIQKDRLFLVICFKDRSKSNILKCFNLISEQTLNDNSLEVLTKTRLEKCFLNFIVNPLDPHLKLEQSGVSLLIKNNKIENSIFCFKLNLNLIEEKKVTFISNLINIIRYVNEKGIFLFHFRTDRNNIILIPIFIEILNGDVKKSINHKKINSFFNCQLLDPISLEAKHFGSLLWRLPIIEKPYYLKDYKAIFNKKIKEIYIQIEEKLLKRDINFIKINKKMFLIEKKVLFIILSNMNPIFIKKIIEKFYKKYFILILFLKKRDYLNLKKEIKGINSLKNLLVMSKEEFKNLNYDFNDLI